MSDTDKTEGGTILWSDRETLIEERKVSISKLGQIAEKIVKIEKKINQSVDIDVVHVAIITDTLSSEIDKTTATGDSKLIKEKKDVVHKLAKMAKQTVENEETIAHIAEFKKKNHQTKDQLHNSRVPVILIVTKFDTFVQDVLQGLEEEADEMGEEIDEEKLQEKAVQEATAKFDKHYRAPFMAFGEYSPKAVLALSESKSCFTHLE